MKVMELSNRGLTLIKSFEGLRTVAYKDVAGVWTIGYGHTSGVKAGQVITEAQALIMLKEDCDRFVKHVNGYQTKYGWNQNQFDALVSFAFNLGSIDKLTANGTRSNAVIVQKMVLYNKAGGKVIAGLTNRRIKEQKLFLDTDIEQSPLVWGICTGDGVRLRKSASLSGDILDKIYKGQGMTWNPNKDTGDWCRVNYCGVDGYIHKDYIKKFE